MSRSLNQTINLHLFPDGHAKRSLSQGAGSLLPPNYSLYAHTTTKQMLPDDETIITRDFTGSTEFFLTEMLTSDHLAAADILVLSVINSNINS